MNPDDILIRPARREDLTAILAVHVDAFGANEGPVIASLVQDMLADPTAEPIHSCVAESAEKIVGHLLFTSVKIEQANASTGTTFAQILAPLAVCSDQQGQGIGSRLVTAGLKQLATAGVELVFVLGYPGYYSRFGFAPAGVRGFQAPYPIAEKNADAWMVLELRAGAMDSSAGQIRCCQTLDQEKYWLE